MESLVNIHETNNEKGKSINAIWDTGATCSVITRKIVDLLGLIPTGFVEVHTANGTPIQRTFIIDIKLPNGVLVKGIPAI